MVGVMKRIAVAALLSTTLASGAAEANIDVSKLSKSSVFSKVIKKLELEHPGSLIATMVTTTTGVGLTQAFLSFGMEEAAMASTLFTGISAFLHIVTVNVNTDRTERLEEELRAAIRSSSTQEQQPLLLENIDGYVEVSSEDDLFRTLGEWTFDADALSALNNRTSAIVEEKGGFPLVVIRKGLLLNNGDFVSFTNLYGEGGAAPPQN